MANTKNYSLREKIIDYYLSHGWYTRQQIEDACNRELEAHRESPISSRQTIINDFLTIKNKYNVTASDSSAATRTEAFSSSTSFPITNSSRPSLPLANMQKCSRQRR